MKIHDAPNQSSYILPLVSVCIPTYNRASQLNYSVRKLLASDYNNIEIIISDNASTDGTHLVGRALALESERVVYHRQEVNLGVTRNFEFVRSKANGKYFLWHADDDYLDPDYITVCVSALEKDETMVLASGLSIYDLNDRQEPRKGNVIQLISEIAEFRILKYLWNVGDNSIFCGAYRTAAVKDCELSQMLAGDWLWISEVASVGKIKVFPTSFVHREAGRSASSSPEGYKKLVQALGLPHWNAAIPELAIAYALSKRIACTSKAFDKVNFVRRGALSVVVFFLMLIKGALPFAIRTAMKIRPLVSAYRRLKVMFK